MNRLKELRISRSLKQEDIYRFMQVAKSTYSYWENGRTEPDQASLIKLANFYDVTIDYLIGNESNSQSTTKTTPQLTPEEQTLLDAFREFTPGKKKALFDMLDIGQEENIKKNKNYTK